jgi:hypothetical protein
MKIQIRTKDDLVKLLSEGISYAWRVNKGHLNSITEVEIYNFNGNAKIVGSFEREKTKVLDNGRVAVAFNNAKIESCEFKWIGQNPIKYISDENVEMDILLDEMEQSELSDGWDIDNLSFKGLLFSNCEGISGQDVGLRTSSFRPVENFVFIINYFNTLFSDNDIDYLFRYELDESGEIVLEASTYLLKLGGELFENSIDEYYTEELIVILKSIGLNNSFLSIIKDPMTGDGAFSVGDLIEKLFILTGQTVKVECIDYLYGNSEFELKCQ